MRATMLLDQGWEACSWVLTKVRDLTRQQNSSSLTRTCFHNLPWHWDASHRTTPPDAVGHARAMTHHCYQHTSNTQHTSAGCRMHVSGLQENPRNNKALVITRNQTKSDSNGWWIGESGKISRSVKSWLTLCNCQAMSEPRSKDSSCSRKLILGSAASPKILVQRMASSGERGRNISESKSGHQKSFRNTSPNVFQAIFLLIYAQKWYTEKSMSN